MSRSNAIVLRINHGPWFFWLNEPVTSALSRLKQVEPIRINNRGLKEGDAAYLFIRPEVLRPSRDGDAEGDTMFETVTIKEEFEGSFLHVFLKSDNDQKPFKMAIVNDAGVQRRDPGTPVKVSFDPDRAVALPVGELADE